jgi:hypothetical protein
MAGLDPRWEWHEIRLMGQRDPIWIKGRCNHLEAVPVTSCVTGEELAQLCLTCDGQLPPGDPARGAGPTSDSRGGGHAPMRAADLRH